MLVKRVFGLGIFLGAAFAASLLLAGSALSASFETSFGSSGSANGEFSHPAGLTIGAEGVVWVADSNNNRIQKLSSTGEYLSKFGSGGFEPGEFSRPTAVAVDASGNLWVTDANNNRIQKFNPAGEFLKAVGSAGGGPGQFSGPEGIAADGEGHIWVADTYNGRLQEFNEAGEFLQTIGSYGAEPGELGEPTDVDVGPEGKLWVADWQNNRVAVFDAEGEFLFQFGNPGSGKGNFAHPDGIDVDASGNVWVGDEGNDRVEQFDETGAYVDEFGASGSGVGQFSFGYPFGLVTDSKGRIWVADPNNDRIQRWTTAALPTCFSGEGETGVNEALVLGAGALECEGEGTLEYEITTAPSHGELSSFNPATGAFTYQPDPEYQGKDSFKFAAANELGKSIPKTFSIQVGEPPPSEGLVTAYAFNENEGEVTADSANGLDGELGNSPTWVQGKYGAALNFVGEDADYVFVPPDPAFDLPEEFTAEAWIRPRILTSSAPVITKANGPYDWSFMLSAGGYEWGVPAAYVRYEEGSWERAEDVEELPPETWTHLALTYNGELLRLYVNGQLAASEVSPPPNPEEAGLHIGIGPNTGSVFDGKIDEVRIYERALNGTQIEKDMETPIAGIEGSEDPEEPEEPEPCEAPVIEVGGGAADPERPGVDLEVEVKLGSPPCADNGEQSRVNKIEVTVDEETVYLEDRTCQRPPDPCSRSIFRHIQLPWQTVADGEPHDIEVNAEDQLGNQSEPLKHEETTPPEGTVSKAEGKAADATESPGCKTPKNRHPEYRFVGHVVYGTDCADVMGAYPKHHTTIYKPGAGDDVIRAGGEVDKIKAGPGDDRIYAGRGNDFVNGQNGADQLNGGSGDDELLGKTGNDLLAGNPGADIMRGGEGDDLLRGGGTADSLLGGTGTDTVSFADGITPGFSFGEFGGKFPEGPEGRGTWLSFNQEVRQDKLGNFIRAFNGSTARYGGGVDKLYVDDGGFPHIIGTPFADFIEGNDEANTIDGGGGQDILKGGKGNDSIYGGADSDLIEGGEEQAAGSIKGGAGDDVCVEGGEAEPCERTEGGIVELPGAVAIGTFDPENPAADTGVFVRGTGSKNKIIAVWNEEANTIDFTAKGEGGGFDPALHTVSGCTLEKASEEEATAVKAHCPTEGVQTVVIAGGAANDVLRAEKFPPTVSVTLLGGTDNDNLRGGISEDVLVDGPGGGIDDLYGNEDDDVLLVNDGRDRAYGMTGSDLFVSGEVCDDDLIKGGTDKSDSDIDNASWAQLRGEELAESDEFKDPTNGVNVAIPNGSGTGDITRNGGSCKEKGHIREIEFLEGSGGPDVLKGNNSHNVILGRSGKDELIGLGAKDNMLANNADPTDPSEAKKRDEDKEVDCGQSDEDIAKGDAADTGIFENCERVNSHAAPAQASTAGIGSEPTSEAPRAHVDESVIGGMRDPEAVAPAALFLLDEATGTEAANWSDEEDPGSYEKGVELAQSGAMEDSSAVQLDGEDDYLDLTTNWDPRSFVDPSCETLSGYSVEMWVKFDAEPESREELFSRTQNGSGVFLYRSGDGRLNFQVDNGLKDPAVSSEPVDDSEWHHVVATMAQRAEACEIISFASFGPEWEVEEAPLLTLSVDGFPYLLGLDGRQIVPAAMPTAHNLVGAREGEEGPLNLLSGSVDDVAIYGEPLDDSEIQTHLLIGEAPELETILLPYLDPLAADEDEDEVADDFDNCPEDANTDQADADGDGVGDACQGEQDSDEDEVPDNLDNCPEDVNPYQEDEDEDGVGDVCEI